MGTSIFRTSTYNPKDPVSIFEYSKFLMGQSLHSLLGDEILSLKRKGKGGLGQMVEELFFKYDINSNQEADFKEAGLELKCTPLLKSKSNEYRIKERLVCTMIDYFEIVNTNFEDSHLIAKCRLMLLLFYLHVKELSNLDYEFVFRILWELPDKDLLLIKKDYETIAEKVKRGEAHLLSEGDTLYLGACRKGQKRDSLQTQPNSEHKAHKRAFSLKPAYMRYVLNHVTNSGQNYFTNYTHAQTPDFELVDSKSLQNRTFDDIILERFKPYYGKNFIEICSLLGIEPYQSKSKYADIAGLIASNKTSKRISKSDEFEKSGIEMKTVRLRSNGMPKESVSFKNIDYAEVLENSDWYESEAYEIFTNRFLFVVFRPIDGQKITLHNNRTNQDITERSYIFDKVFFWTMPTEDLKIAEKYWEHIREKVLANNFSLKSFWNIADHKNFHVRPKGTKQNHTTVNPHGGECPKYCYWFNADYVKSIIDSQSENV